MAFCRLVFPFLVLSVLGTTFAQVPVYIWGDLDGKSTKANPLTTLSEAEFKGVLKRDLVHDPFTVIFIDETLSVEDFSKRDSDGETSFPYLHANIGKAQYLPSVDNSLTVLNGLADPEKVDHVKLTENGLSAEIEPDSGKFLFIVLKDAREGESRSELLRRHNDFMEKMFGELQGQYKELVAIYTAQYPSWVIPEAHIRVRRQAEGAEKATTDYVMDGLRLYAKNIIVADNKKNSILSGYTGSESTFNDTSMATKMTFSNNVLTLKFTQKAGYWFFETVTIQQSSPRELIRELVPTSEVYAFVGFSYRCGQNISFTTVNETEQFTLTFHDSKVQPFFKQSNSSETPVFGDSINCVGFFSVPIWAGLFVVFILLAITFYGIMMMMDIRTMDRFDDPKGKTITINAGE